MTYPTKTESAEYRMVTGSARSVSDEITELFNEGWELHGSAFSVGISVCQPVVKKKRVFYQGYESPETSQAGENN